MTAKTDLERASAPQAALAEAVADGNVKMSAILNAVGIKPDNPVHQAALLACDRYDLDPLLKHIIVIPNGGLYVTRDGLLHIAHRSGQFDGMEVVDQHDTDAEWIAKVSVHRKDMGRPFTYVGRYPHSGSNKKYGPEMAVKVAEVAALRRAFAVALPTVEEQWGRDRGDERAPVTVAEITGVSEPADDTTDIIDVDVIDAEPFDDFPDALDLDGAA